MVLGIWAFGNGGKGLLAVWLVFSGEDAVNGKVAISAFADEWNES